LRIPDVPVEVVTWRVAAWAPAPTIEAAHLPVEHGEPQPHRTRQVRFERGGAAIEIPVYRRDALGIGATVVGPAIVEERETTTVIRPGWTMLVSSDGSLVASKGTAQ
jgi:N-methylhydantoinase A